MRYLPKAVTAFLVVGAAVVLFAARGTETRGAALQPGDPGGVADLLGSEIPAMAVTVHNATHVNLTTASVGTELHPNIVMGGAFGPPTGTVDGYIFGNGTCAGTSLTKVVSDPLVLGRADLTTTTIKPTAAGTISFRVHYLGSGIYAARWSPCISFTITKATPSVGVVVHNGSHAEVTSVDVGDAVHPYVTVLSRVGGPTGQVSVSWWTNGTCSGGSSAAPGLYTLVAGKVDTTYFQIGNPGSYSFRAHFQGDAGFKPADSACVKYTVKKADVAFHTALHDSAHATPDTMLVGEGVHPFATLAGLPGYPAPSGSLNIASYGTPDCSGFGANNATPVAPSMELTSFTVAPAQPISRSWQLSYSGDSLYQAKTGPCMSATWKGAASAILTLHNQLHKAVTSITVGTKIHVRVDVTGSFATPTGTGGIRQWDNASCSGGAYFKIAMFALDGSGIGHDPNHEWSWDVPGTHSFKVDYGGDGSYLQDTSPCVVLTVTAVPTATPKPSAAPASTPVPTTESNATADPGVTAEPGATTDPGATAPTEPGATEGSGSGSGTGSGPTPAPTTAAVPAGSVATSSDSGIVVLLLFVIVALLLAIAVMVWRTRRPAAAAVR